MNRVKTRTAAKRNSRRPLPKRPRPTPRPAPHLAAKPAAQRIPRYPKPLSADRQIAAVSARLLDEQHIELAELLARSPQGFNRFCNLVRREALDQTAPAITTASPIQDICMAAHPARHS